MGMICNGFYSPPKICLSLFLSLDIDVTPHLLISAHTMIIIYGVPIMNGSGRNDDVFQGVAMVVGVVSPISVFCWPRNKPNYTDR